MSLSSAIISVFIFINLCFIIATIRKDNSIMTAAWPIGILLIELVFFNNLAEIELHHYIVLAMICLWALRLFAYTLLRNLKRGYEDFRYRGLREESQSGFLIRAYFQFFVIQGIFMFIISLPAIGMNSSSEIPDNLQLMIGGIILIIGFVVETIADWQLYQFKATNDKQAVLQSGLWKFSRHPNYLGEIIIWWGIVITGLHSDIWWIVIGPVVLTLLLRYISGVPLIESRYNDNELYQQYKENVNPIFPI